MDISTLNCKFSLLRNFPHFVTQAATHQVLSLKNVPLEPYRFSMVRFLFRCALRLKTQHLGVAQLGARYLGVTMTARSSLVT